MSNAKRARVAVMAVVLIVAVGSAVVWWARSGGEPPVPATETPCALFPAIDGQLADWMVEWRAHVPGMNCSGFRRVESTALAGSLAALALYEWPHEAAERALDRHRSPSGRYVVLVGSEALQVVDTEVRLLTTLLERPAPGRFEDAAWLDDRRLLVAGLAAVEGGRSAVLTLDLLDRQLGHGERFTGPQVEAP